MRVHHEPWLKDSVDVWATSPTIGLWLITMVGSAPLAPWRPAAAQDDLARELPRIKPLEPAAALESFRFSPDFISSRSPSSRWSPTRSAPATTPMGGFTSSRCAAIRFPSRSLPATSPGSRIAMATGGSRRGAIFLDGLSWPTGVVPFDGGVFIAAAPDIIYAKDTSGDGVADVKDGRVHGV